MAYLPAPLNCGYRIAPFSLTSQVQTFAMMRGSTETTPCGFIQKDTVSELVISRLALSGTEMYWLAPLRKTAVSGVVTHCPPKSVPVFPDPDKSAAEIP